ncbi:MAG: DegV family protein [Bacillaceae bacterium]|nr:DegV family protein [Bacillaceae bacterium]
MSKVCIVTDSTADIPPHILEKLDVTIVPLKVHMGEDTYLDGQTITTSEFYKRLPQEAQLPSTSQPSPMDFVDAYKKLAEQHGPDVQIISVHLSAAMSGTYQSANLASSMLEDMDITVMDSKKASYALGHIIVKLDQAVKQGKSRDECVELVEKMIVSQQVYFIVDTLEYLQKGGRIGKASALLGTLLNVKPILSLDLDGEIYAFDKVRGSKRAVRRILELCEHYVKENGSVELAILHSDNHEKAEQFRQQLQALIGEDEEIIVSELGPVIGAHIGPGVLAVLMDQKH